MDRKSKEAQAAAAGDAELTALLAEQLAESEAAETAAFAELDQEAYVGLNELELPEPTAAVTMEPTAADAEDDGDDEDAGEDEERSRPNPPTPPSSSPSSPPLVSPSVGAGGVPGGRRGEEKGTEEVCVWVVLWR